MRILVNNPGYLRVRLNAFEKAGLLEYTPDENPFRVARWVMRQCELHKMAAIGRFNVTTEPAGMFGLSCVIGIEALPHGSRGYAV